VAHSPLAFADRRREPGDLGETRADRRGGQLADLVVVVGELGEVAAVGADLVR
jgi:hypothetical protein